MSDRRLESAIYRGWLRHRRTEPTTHVFRYQVAMFFLDLAELGELDRVSRLFGIERSAPISFRRSDYLGDADIPLDQAVRDLVDREVGQRPRGRICLLTNPRYFGYVMNPVSFYYCFADDGHTVDTVVAEINNTPWDERHQYVLSARDQVGDGSTRQYRFRKDFHVSPFMAMDQEYDWRFTEPGRRLAVHMVNEEAGAPIFDATLRVERSELTARNIRSTLLRYPLMTAKVVSAIYWNAARLRLKGIPFIDHPAYAEGRSPYSHT